MANFEDRPRSLLIGLGGTGSRVVANVAQKLKSQNIKFNDGNICCAVLDTDSNDRKLLKRKGLDIPIIATSDDLMIRDYMSMYDDVDEWLPTSPRLLKESMRDGASQMRPKSRLAFFDTMSSDKITELKNHISSLLDRNSGSKIRVMLVSSLAGGTGSGMFIQTALWIRRFFEAHQAQITIRGIFLLPDVFIRTINSIRKSQAEQDSLYANAYASIGEMNVISKVKSKGSKGVDLARSIVLDDLFDSRLDNGEGSPLLDFAFFVDDTCLKGAAPMSSLTAYENATAQMIYMQLYAPMCSPMYSEEDNLFKPFENCVDPVYGSCGTAKAMYPTEDILNYCALRSTKDSLSKSWSKLDREIRALIQAEDARRKSGEIIVKRLDPRETFANLFAAELEKFASGDLGGKNSLFREIASHVDKQIPRQDDKGNAIRPTMKKKEDCYSGELLAYLEKHIKDEKPGDYSSILLDDRDIDVDTGVSGEDLSAFVEGKEQQISDTINSLPLVAKEEARKLIEWICPVDMGDVNYNSPNSLFSYLRKDDVDGTAFFVHPLAARYLLIRLLQKMSEIKASTISKEAIAKGAGKSGKPVSFDNPKTPFKIEVGVDGFLNSKTFYQTENSFAKDFKKRYIKHNQNRVNLAEKYMIEEVQYQVAKLLIERVDMLLKQYENFFSNLDIIDDTIEDEIRKNIDKNDSYEDRIVYICASEEDKENLYKSLRIDVEANNDDLNEIVATAFYGKLCAAVKPYAENNKEYNNQDARVAFLNGAIRTFAEKIMAEHQGEVDLDIYDAVCKSADMKYAEQKKEEEVLAKQSNLLNLFSKQEAQENESEARKIRYADAMAALVSDLKDSSAPFLICDNGQRENFDEHTRDSGELYDGKEKKDPILAPVKLHKTFWGFHSSLAEKCKEIGDILDVEVERQQNNAYPRNELLCYRAVYGIEAKYIPKLNESKTRDANNYYRAYRKVIDAIQERVKSGDKTALINTPHLDKTWHLFMPAVTSVKRRQDAMAFYRGLWLATAYDKLKVKGGNFQIAQDVISETGKTQSEDVPVIYKGKPVSKTDIVSLLDALRADGCFAAMLSDLEAKLRDDIEESSTYEGSTLLRGFQKAVGKKKTTTAAANTEAKQPKVAGGLATSADTNAVTMIVRYCADAHSVNATTNNMIDALEEIVAELVQYHYREDQKKEVEKIKNELCRRIFDASALKSKPLPENVKWGDNYVGN